MYWFQPDKANNVVFVCNAHYHNCILNELGINSTDSLNSYPDSELSDNLQAADVATLSFFKILYLFFNLSVI